MRTFLAIIIYFILGIFISSILLASGSTIVSAKKEYFNLTIMTPRMHFRNPYAERRYHASKHAEFTKQVKILIPILEKKINKIRSKYLKKVSIIKYKQYNPYNVISFDYKIDRSCQGPYRCEVLIPTQDGFGFVTLFLQKVASKKILMLIAKEIKNTVLYSLKNK